MRITTIIVFLTIIISSTATISCNNYETCKQHVTSLKNEIIASTTGKSSTQQWLLRGLQFAEDALATDNMEEWNALAHHTRNPEVTPGNYCPNDDAFEFCPVYQTSVKLNSSVKFKTNGFDACFPEMEVSFSSTAPGGKVGGNKWGYLHFKIGLPTKLKCADSYIAGTKFGKRTLSVGTIDHIYKKMHINVTYVHPGEYEDVLQNGIQIMVAPCGSLGTIKSVLNTVALFYSKDPANIREANKKFLLYRKIFDVITPRKNATAVTKIDKNSIKSGDTLQVVKLDGLDQLVSWGTGGRTGHVTIAVWKDDELYVCESTDASPFGSYWPPPYGIIHTPFDEWVQLAIKAGFVVDILPLSKDASSAFSEKLFWTWFGKVQGMPYGYHVMLYSFLDTYSPAQNLPLPFDKHSIDYMFPTLDRLVGHDNTSTGSNMYALLGEGLNHRLNISCEGSKMMDCISNTLVERNLSYAEATAVPENDEWLYDANSSTGFKGNYSMMCSAFVANAYKVSMGTFLPLFQSHEFTPKDIYQLKIFDTTTDASKSRFNVNNCPGGALIQTSTGNYCQLLGEFVLTLNGYNTVSPYKGMNNHCASQWPNYDETVRPC